MTAIQDERFSSRLFKSDVVLCSKAKASCTRFCTVATLMSRKQKYLPLSVIGITRVESYENGPLTLVATFSMEMPVPVAPDRSLAVRSRRS
jgi:hypothetical protein